MMKETTLTIEQIEAILVAYPHSPFYIRQHIGIPNVSWGFLNHEADLLVITKAGYLTEIEIKRTWEDFKADFRKDHTHDAPKLSHFYYAVPKKIGQKVFDFLYEGNYKCRNCWYDSSIVKKNTENNPHGCGLIIFGDEEETGMKYGRCCINVVSSRMGKYKVSTEEKLQLLRLCGMRIWNLKKKLAKLQMIK